MFSVPVITGDMVIKVTHTFRCMISSLQTAAATRAALPVPLDVHGILVCPDNGIAASVLQNVNVGLFTDTFQARSFD